MDNEILISSSAWVVIPFLSVFIIGAIFIVLIKKGVEGAPAILTTSGILMTFVGIALALTVFDVNDIAKSIPNLINGMSFAFWSSIAGMSLGLLAKYILSKKAKEKEADYRPISVDSFFELMKSQSESLIKINYLLEKVSENSDSSKDGLKGLHERIELQHAREMELNREQHREQITELRDFAQKVSEIGSKQLIEALESVIRDFNTQLNEQFGENFKQLNEAVFKLVEWQEEYREQLIELKDQYDKSLQAVKGLDSTMVSIKDSCTEIPLTMEKVSEFTQLAQQELKDLESHLEAFAELKERASSAMPEIKNALEEIFKNMQMGVDEATSHHSKLLEKSEKMAQNYVEATKVSIDKYSEQQEAILSKQSEVFGGFVSHVELAQKDIIDKAQAGIQSLVDHIKIASEEQFDKLQQSAEKISKINEVLESVTSSVNTESIKLQNALRTQIDQLIQDIKQSASQVQQEQIQLVKNIFAGVEQELENSLKATQDAVQKEVNLVEQALESEINQAMTGLGRSLGGIMVLISEEYQRMLEANNSINRQDV